MTKTGIGLMVLVMVGILVAVRIKTAEVTLPTGLNNGNLAPCPAKRNCVSSEEQDAAHSTEPLTFSDSSGVAWNRLKETLSEMGGKFEKEENGYLWFSFVVKPFGFVDDMEFRLDAENQRIHVRSASRLGYWDLGVNSRRVAGLRSRF